VADGLRHRLRLWDGALDISGADHDYDPEWDYEVSYDADGAFGDEVRAAMEEVERDVLPAFGVRDAVVFLFEDENSEDRVGVYVNGTSSYPFIGVSAARLWRETDARGFREEMLTTVVHELGHAYLDRNGVDEAELDFEEVVEAVARGYAATGQVDLGPIAARLGQASFRK